jgi:phosphatidylglycerophosphatase A
MTTAAQMIKRMVMTGFGLGYAPVASGTFGSAGAIVISMLVWGLWSGGNTLRLDAAWVILAAISSICCVAWAPWAVEYYSSRARKMGDPGHVVIDEFAGQWVSLIALPMPGHDQWMAAMAILAVQFFLFRVFDVLKLPPGRQFEKLPAGWGILMDDLAAGVYANLVGQVIFRMVVY